MSSPCGVAEQTAVHVILKCELIPGRYRDMIFDILGGSGCFAEDIVTLLDASRDRNFMEVCVMILKEGMRFLRTTIILDKVH